MVENTALLRMQDGQPLEAVIMAGLAHAQVVHTIAHLMVRAPTSMSAAACRPRGLVLGCGPDGILRQRPACLRLLVHFHTARLHKNQSRYETARGQPRAEAGSATEHHSGPLFKLNYKHHVQVPAGKVDSVWDSARVHDADLEQKAQLKRVAEAKNGHAWLLLEYMDRGSLHQVQGLGFRLVFRVYVD